MGKSNLDFYQSINSEVLRLAQEEAAGNLENELATVLSSIALACKQISSLVTRAGVSNLTGAAGAQNESVRPISSHLFAVPFITADSSYVFWTKVGWSHIDVRLITQPNLSTYLLQRNESHVNVHVYIHTWEELIIFPSCWAVHILPKNQNCFLRIKLKISRLVPDMSCNILADSLCEPRKTSILCIGWGPEKARCCVQWCLLQCAKEQWSNRHNRFWRRRCACRRRRDRVW